MTNSNNINDEEFKNEEGKFFKTYISQAENSLTKEQIAAFAALNTNEERIKFVYNLNIINNLELPKFSFGKNATKALEFKEVGNKLYGQSHFGKAAKNYWYGLLQCPASEGELLSVLHANRSACLYNMQEYDSSLEDIHSALSLPYPKNLHHKLFERRARCYMALNDLSPALESFKKALTALDDSKFDSATRMKKGSDFGIMIELMNKTLKTKSQGEKKQEKTSNLPQVPQLSRETNKKYPSVSNVVNFDSKPEEGRFAVASEAIEAGEVLLIEPAHCATLIFQYSRSHCQQCFCRVKNPFPCNNCTSVVFCSLKCREIAMRTYHKFECSFHGSLLTEGASITCCLAVRLITQCGMKYFRNIRPKLKLLDGTLSDKKYDPSDYKTVYNLCSHSDRRSPTDFFQRSTMAVILLRLLQNANFFENKSDLKFSEDEELIGGLLLHHLQLLQFNAHEISELQFSSDYPGDISKAKSTFIAGGLFPTLALFNHSCEPGIARYFSGSKVIVRAVKPIATGEMIAENYGPIYTQVKKESRQTQLKTRYWFDCSCIPCKQNWPLFESMGMSILPFKCTRSSTCPGYIEVGASTEEFTFDCPECKGMICIFAGLRSLNETEEMFNKGERLVSEHRYLEALYVFLKIIKVLGSTLKPPFRDFCLCQQKIRSCMLTLGNKIQLQKQ